MFSLNVSYFLHIRILSFKSSELVIWQFAVMSKSPHFYGKISGHVVIYRGKDKTQCKIILQNWQIIQSHLKVDLTAKQGAMLIISLMSLLLMKVKNAKWD